MKPSLCLLLGCFVSSSDAWGPRFEPGASMGGSGHRTVEAVSRILVLQAALRKDDDGDTSDNDDIEKYRSRLESTYFSYLEDQDCDETYAGVEFWDFLKPVAVSSREGESETAKQVAESLASSWLDIHCGEDCEECLIPDDLKILPEHDEQINVMEFLGIRRAEPLRKVSDWE